MAKVFKKTLTVRGIEENVKRFASSLKNVKYLLDGEFKEMDFLKVSKTEDTVSIYLYFDDGIVGDISNVEILDMEDEVIIRADDKFTKSRYKGFYILFEYTFIEEVM